MKIGGDGSGCFRQAIRRECSKYEHGKTPGQTGQGSKQQQVSKQYGGQGAGFGGKVLHCRIQKVGQEQPGQQRSECGNQRADQAPDGKPQIIKNILHFVLSFRFQYGEDGKKYTWNR